MACCCNWQCISESVWYAMCLCAVLSSRRSLIWRICLIS